MVQTIEKPASKSTEAQLEKFERFEREAKQPAWVFPLRKAGIARFAEHGFPTLQDEDWRFTNLAPIAKLPFKAVFAPAKGPLPRSEIASSTFGGFAVNRLVFTNGHFVPELSSVISRGAEIKSLAVALAENPATLQEHLDQRNMAALSPGTREHQYPGRP